MGEQVRVGVLGAAGRMGASVCEAVEADSELLLVAAFDPYGTGAVTAQGLDIQTDLDTFLAASPDVVVDFTVARPDLPTMTCPRSKRRLPRAIC